jgi:hypothetical protein
MMPRKPAGVLDAGPQDIALGAEQRHRDGGVVDEMQDRDRNDEGQVEPVGDIDMRFAPGHQGAQEDHEIGDPDDGKPQIDIPFGFGVFLALADPQHIAQRRQHDEELVSPEHEGGEPTPAEQRRPAGPLHHVKRRREQRVATEGEDDRRRVDRPQTAEAEPLESQIENRKSQLESDEYAHRETDDPPEYRGYGELPDDCFVIAGHRGEFVVDCHCCHNMISQSRIRARSRCARNRFI